MLVRPTLPEWSEGGHDRVMLRKLDIDNIRVISSILGQSIALDHYAKKVIHYRNSFSFMSLKQYHFDVALRMLSGRRVLLEFRFDMSGCGK